MKLSILRLRLLGSIFVICLTGYGQSINELLLVVDKSTTENERARAYLHLLHFSIYSHSRSTDLLFKKLETEIIANPSKVLTSIYKLENAYYEREIKDNYEASFSILRDLIPWFMDYNLKDELGMCYNYISSLVYWNKIGDTSIINSDYMYQEYIEPMKELIPDIRDENIKIILYLNIGSYYATLTENKDSMLFYYHKAENELNKTIFDYNRICIYGSLAIIYSALKDEQRTLYYLNVCESDTSFNNDIYVKGNVYRAMSKFYLLESSYKNLDKSLLYAKMALPMAYKTANMTYISLASARLYETYKSMNLLDSALFYYEKYKNAEDIISREKFRLTISQNEIIRKDLQLQELNNSKLRVQNENFKLVRTMLVIGLFFGSIVLIWYSYNNRLIRDKNEQLEQKNREIRDAFFEGKSQEQKRFASELHDNLNTKIAAMGWQLEAMDKEKLSVRDKNIIEKVTQISKDLYNDIRLIAHNTIPTELSTHGLEMALNKLMILLNSHDRPKFHIISEMKQDFNSNVNNEIYKIILELSNNVLKHSNASDTWISIISQNDQLILTVVDNGVGLIESVNPSEGLGLKSIQSRVENLKGTMKITSQNNPGYKTEIRIPI